MRTISRVLISIILLVGFFTSTIMVTPTASAMNKADLIEAIASDAGLTKADAKRALEAFIDSTTAALKKGDRVALVGFGSFSVTKRASTAADKNPEKAVMFKAGDMPRLPNVQYTDTDDIIDYIVKVVNDPSDKKITMTREQVKRFMDAFLSIVIKSLENGESVDIEGFGKFTVTNKSERTGRNPQTGATIKIPAKKVVKFKAGADLASTVK